MLVEAGIGRVADYRFYYFEGALITRAEAVECADDGEALQQALELNRDELVEVWKGRRRVGLIKPPHSRDPGRG
jgi:hypothetical protein